eukprot:TRINITY_DN543_c0_g1_i7.p1 TRINITY_DN543_c0_g1~~TRINITY_DN543_c0_g1_i7.p1  ORF type:complete len:781 (+),score=146.45 TRINITY_DN543_c0_g1_i7:266-2608(+)
MHLYNNRLNGTVPDFSNLASLKELYLFSNQLSGTIPDFSNLANLTQLDLSNNRLSGQLPEFSGLSSVSGIFLFENLLNGTLPSINLAQLQTFDVRSNDISGTIPFGFGESKLGLLDLSNNKLNGTIPRSFENMEGLRFLDLSNNKFEGSMPTKFWTLPNLFSIDLSHNRFSGDVRYFMSPATGNWEYRYNTLNLEGNQLFGILDSRVFDIPQILYLNLKNNSLTGLGDLPTTRLWKRLDLSDNPIKTPIPDSFGLFSQMDYFGLRNTHANHQNNSLIPTFTEPVDPYNLRDRFDLFICPTIRATNSSSQTEIAIDSEYYGKGLCQCLPNYFGFAGRCVLCPNECECNDGLSLKRCHASPNIASIQTIIECPQPLSCVMEILPVDYRSTKVPVVEQVCEVGYTGRACSRCDAGYGRQGRGCVLCGDSVVATSITMSVLSISAFVLYAYKWSKNGSGKTRIMIFHVQTLSILSSVWTASKDLDGIIEWSYTLGSLQMPNLGCVLDSTNLADTLTFSFLRIPIVVFAGLLMFFISSSRRDKVVYVTLNVLLLFSYNITRDTFGVFGCTVYDEGGDSWYLNVAPWIECDPMSAEMERMMKMAVPVFLLYVIGLPLGLLYALKKRNAEDESDTQRIGFLYMAYKEDCWFWELLIMLRRLLFSFATSVLPYTHPGISFFVLLMVIQASIWLQHKKQPYKSDLDNKMEMLSLYVIFVSFVVALLANMFGSDAWMFGFIVVLNVGTFAYFVVFGIVKPWNLQRKDKYQVGATERPAIVREVVPAAQSE